MQTQGAGHPHSDLVEASTAVALKGTAVLTLEEVVGSVCPDGGGRDQLRSHSAPCPSLTWPRSSQFWASAHLKPCVAASGMAQETKRLFLSPGTDSLQPLGRVPDLEGQWSGWHPHLGRPEMGCDLLLQLPAQRHHPSARQSSPAEVWLLVDGQKQGQGPGWSEKSEVRKSRHACCYHPDCPG